MTYARGRLGEGDLSKIRVVGEEPSRLRKKFRPHRDYAEQKRWQVPPQTLSRLLVD
jgi:hypothetical protein